MHAMALMGCVFFGRLSIRKVGILLLLALSGMVIPARSAIIGEESRGYMTKEEYAAIGQAVGYVRCIDPRSDI